MDVIKQERKKLIRAYILATIMYIVQFIALPNIFKFYYPFSRTASSILMLSTMVFADIAFCLMNLKFTHIAVSNMVYLMLVMAYPAHGAYGIGLIVEETTNRIVFNEDAVPYSAVSLWSTILLLQALTYIIYWIMTNKKAIDSKLIDRQGRK